MCPGNLERWYSLWPQLVCHGFALGKGLDLHFLLHLPSPRIMFHGGDIDAHDHGQQVVTLKCWIVANKINCWAGHSHLSVSPWQTSFSHPQVLDLAVCCRQQRTTWGAWSFRAWEPLLRCELWRKSLWWKIACARCSSSQAYFPHSMRKIHASLPEWITDTIFNYRTYVLPPTPQWLLQFYIWQKQASRPLKGVACISPSSSCQPLQGPGAGLHHTWKWGRFRQQFGTHVT